ncbi:hypothetical protein [Methanobrevibacter arboriphilus]|nr:hypothetical protein [Methanobrevibacter arboriphilus]
MDGKQIIMGGKSFCKSCAEGSYYRIL